MRPRRILQATGIVLGVATFVMAGLCVTNASKGPEQKAGLASPLGDEITAPARALGSAFAVVAAHVRPSVVSVSSEKMLKLHSQEMPFPFGDDFFRHFFGGNFGAPAPEPEQKEFRVPQRGMGPHLRDPEHAEAGRRGSPTTPWLPWWAIGPAFRWAAALLGRMVTIPYYPLGDEMIGNIARLQLGRVAKRVQESHRIPFTYDDAVVRLIASRCTELESGGRMIDSILTNTLLPRISQELLTRMMQGKPVTRVATTVTGGEFEYAFD